jgi:hypothetical protein
MKYADGAVLKEKLWSLIAQNEPSLISVQLVTPVPFEYPKNNLLIHKMIKALCYLFWRLFDDKIMH